MRRQRRLYLLALSFALGAASNIRADGPTLTAIDFPGATSTLPRGINARGDIVGRYLADGVNHAYLLSGGQFSMIDFPGATFTSFDAINQRGDIVGRYTLDGVSRGYVLVGFRPACVAGN